MKYKNFLLLFYLYLDTGVVGQQLIFAATTPSESFLSICTCYFILQILLSQTTVNLLYYQINYL